MTSTYVPDLALLLVDMVENHKYRYYHTTSEGGYISWYDFVCEIFKQVGCDTGITSVSTTEHGLSRATRPFNSRLYNTKLVKYSFKLLPDWYDILRSYLKGKDHICDLLERVRNINVNLFT